MPRIQLVVEGLSLSPHELSNIDQLHLSLILIQSPGRFVWIEVSCKLIQKCTCRYCMVRLPHFTGGVILEATTTTYIQECGCWMVDEWSTVILCAAYLCYILLPVVYIVLNGKRSSGEILGMRELLHWLIRECSTTSRHWGKYLLDSTRCCNNCLAKRVSSSWAV